MIEVRLFATLREGRGKIQHLDASEISIAADIIRRLDIPSEEVAILLINGFHQKPETPVKGGDIGSIFPPGGCG